VSWAAGYIGIDYAHNGRDREGIDCWGLVRLVLSEQRGIELPGFDDVAVDRRAMTIGSNALKYGDEIESPEAFAVVLMLYAGAPHVGICIDSNRMLHIDEDCVGSHIVEFGHKVKKRIYGYYRPIDNT